MKFHVMTLFPEMFSSYMDHSIMKRALDNGVFEFEAINIRDYSTNKHKKVDDYPFGGGAGMVMTPQPIYDCFKKIEENLTSKKPRVIYLTPKGQTFNQKMAEDLSKEEELIFLCGHYEGVDQRVLDMIVTDEISLGDFVLTGGELPTLTMIDAIVRLLPGALGCEESFQDESFSSGLLEYPQYTRPREFLGQEVPQVLLSGNHKNIDTWRRQKSIEITHERRPEIIDETTFSKKEKEFYYNLKKSCKK